MTRTRQLWAYVDVSVDEAVRAATTAAGQTVSEWIRTAIITRLQDDGIVPHPVRHRWRTESGERPEAGAPGICNRGCGTRMSWIGDRQRYRVNGGPWVSFREMGGRAPFCGRADIMYLRLALRPEAPEEP